jgi:signal transduction histidine kinase
MLGLTTWLVVGVALFVALRGLHSEATTARLADVTVPLVARARADLAAGMGIPGVLADLRDQIDGTDVGVYLQLADGRIVAVGGGPAVLDGLVVDPTAPAGSIHHGTQRAADGSQYAWVASILREGVRGSRALIAATPDRAAADALRDLLGTLPAVIAVTLLAGIVVAWWLARSVTRPLRRLAEAAGDVPGRRSGASSPLPLPLEGPTEVRELTTRFDAMRSALAESRRRETELLADLRHDLRTPLTVIAGFAQALRDGTARGADADRAAAAIVSESGRIAGLVEDLGAMDRIGVDPGLHPEALDVDVLIAETIARLGATAKEARVELVPGRPMAGRGVAGGSDRALVADRRAIERILSNLVHNALTALATLPDGGEPIRGHAWLEARRVESGAHSSVAISVTDDGPGFPPGMASRAFERFVRGDPSRSGPGSGLGLAIVRELAFAHGGAVHAENVAPHGARVTVTLPTRPG